MKIKALAVAVLLATSGSANAFLNNANGGVDGELFLTVFSSSLQATYNLDLGVYTAEYADTNSMASVNLAADPDFAMFLGATDLVYTVTGAYRALNFDSAYDISHYGLYTTTQSSTSAMMNIAGGGGFNGLEISQSRVADEAGRINANAVATNQPNASEISNFGVNNSSVALIGQTGYYDIAQWGSSLGGVGIISNGVVGTAVDFYHVGWDVQGALDTGVDQITTALLGSWVLDANNLLSYTCAAGSANCAGTNPVPVPAAVWLFGSGLLGLIGVARRKAA